MLRQCFKSVLNCRQSLPVYLYVSKLISPASGLTPRPNANGRPITIRCTSTSTCIYQQVRCFHLSLTQNMETKPRRAMLYVPGSDERKLKKLTNLHVDCAVMDCEDGVALNRKVDARNTIRSMLDELHCPLVRDLSVRINAVSTGMAGDDLVEVFKAERLPDTIMLPKVESKDEIQWFVKEVKSHLKERNLETPLRVVIFTETAIGLLHLQDILEECQRAKDSSLVFEGVVFGSDDFCASIGATRTADAQELTYARQKVVTTAKAFGMQAIDLVYIDFKDSEGLEKQSSQGARMGFTGKQVIHPNQIPIVQRAFSPSGKQITWARELIDAFEKHQATGKGAFDFKGSMIDMPTVLQAKNILKLTETNS